MKLRWTWLLTAVVATAVSMPALAYDHGRHDDHRGNRDAWKQRHDRDDHRRQDQRARWERDHRAQSDRDRRDRWERERRERQRMEHARRERDRSRHDAWERDRRERREHDAAWRRSNEHRPVLRPTSDHPAGWDHGKKTGWGNSDLPPGQARNGDNHGRPFREHR